MTNHVTVTEKTYEAKVHHNKYRIYLIPVLYTIHSFSHHFIISVKTIRTISCYYLIVTIKTRTYLWIWDLRLGQDSRVLNIS